MGKIELDVNHEILGNNALLHFKISDTGYGIKKEDFGKLFEKFARLDSATDNEIEGTGLGLAITKRLVTLLDGKIWFESEYGAGTTFYVDIIQKIGNHEKLGNILEKREKGNELEYIDCSNYHVLLVDDNKLNLKTIEVQNNNGITQMTMKFDNIDYNSNFNSNYFDLNSIIDNIENPDDKLKNNTKDNNDNNQTTKDKNTTTENNNNNNINDKAPDNNKDKTTEQSSAIDDIIYPLYIPTGTSLIDKEKVSKTDGERVILTFDGEKPFLLVEETSSVSDEFSIVPTLGEPYLLIDTIGALTNNSITWSSNGIDYYIVSDAMSQIELIEIASSISSIPTMK